MITYAGPLSGGATPMSAYDEQVWDTLNEHWERRNNGSAARPSDVLTCARPYRWSRGSAAYVPSPSGASVSSNRWDRLPTRRVTTLPGARVVS